MSLAGVNVTNVSHTDLKILKEAFLPVVRDKRKIKNIFEVFLLAQIFH